MDVGQQLRVLESFLSSPGWAIIHAEMSSAADELRDAALELDAEPLARAEAIGQYHGALQALQAPARLIERLQGEMNR